ncbi:MAG: hypothetical protein ACE5FD_17010 [Anaerolineae bacterium]
MKYTPRLLKKKVTAVIQIPDEALADIRQHTTTGQKYLHNRNP